jgi:hypothetical protein
MSDAQHVIDAALDLVWSLWSELGVPGVPTGFGNAVVSPVDLVLFTPGVVGDRDARLATLVQAWCAQHGERTFGARELAVRRTSLPEPARDAFDAWIAVLHEAKGSPWLAPEQPPKTAGPPIGDRDLPYRSDRKPMVHLRARSLFGVGVRADVICALLKADAERRPLTSPEMAHLGHSARAIQQTLGALEAAGVVNAQRESRTHSYTLTRPRDVANLLDADGLSWFPWHHAFPIVFHLVALATWPSADPRVQHVRAHTIARLLGPHVHAIYDLPSIPIRPGDDDADARLMTWGAAAIRSFAVCSR